VISKPPHTVRRAAETQHDVAQGAIVHVEHALPEDAPGIEPQGVVLGEVVVEHGREQIVRAADRVHVAGEVKVDVLHRRQLRAAAAGGSALDAEHGAERRLAQRHHRAPAEPAQAIGEPDRRRGLALAGGGGRHGRDQDQGAVRGGLAPLDGVPRDLRLVVPEGLQLRGGEADGGGDLLDRLERDRARDLEVLLAHVAYFRSPSTRWKTRPSSSLG
jgi:hypothetical protein